MGFKNLSHIHTGWNAERVKHDLDRLPIFEVRHVLFRQDAGDNALVSVTAGHFVPDTQLALHGDIDLDQLDHARRQFVAFGEFVFLLVDDLLQHIDLTRGHLLNLVDLLVHARILIRVLDALQVAGRDALYLVAGQDRTLGQQALVGALVVQVGLHFLAAQDVFQTLQALVGKNPDFIRKILLQFRDLRGFDRLRALVLFLAFARENFHVNDHSLNTRRTVERSIAYVAGLFAEDGTQQLLFRRELGLALGRNFAHQNVALLDAGADADHARLVQIAEHRLANVRNVARHFFRSQLGVAGFDFVFLDVERGVVVLFHHLFGDEDRVLEVVAAPWHESDQDISSQSQLAVIGAGTVGDDLPFQHALSLGDNRLLVDASVLVRTLE